ncbi:mannosyltransferase PIG-V [Thermosporothrix hazakensis]|jgi:hypothetical protein|uniref:Mannosyltransferase PIG-V n=2 Tax=Thermosporothrix TaxID=768650 RepID=A0A326UFY4_THEHA|nr:mannosyltransferase family protein [Thermosporothrix hazakensis]PZW36815.1 mannosyltransferase PIG-V [Thermosporothrix hazakensis]BBH89281.1 hypothetical protein KTC_40320 [Thermosporothrix sp. COM3]GCE47464.1 hypothetical protein KTH_23330 [Thermosporothrix hazakensis]
MDLSNDAHTQNIPLEPIFPAPLPITEFQQQLAPTRPAQVFRPWQKAALAVLPLYTATHIAYFLLTYLSSLFHLENFTQKSLALPMLLSWWGRWDTDHFVFIASKGYDEAWRTAFFPLYPLFESGLALLTRNALVAGLLLSNLALFGVFVILYRLVERDFGTILAARTTLYLALFPTAFFLSAAYNESLFLFFTLLCFYQIRKGRWWLAGLVGFLACLTRSAGILLCLPFCYDYLRQHGWNWRALRLDGLSVLLLPTGLGLFALYCWYRFGDPLAFSHAQAGWNRVLSLPGYGFLKAFGVIRQQPLLGFASIHNVIDLSTGLILLALTALTFVGPWKFSARERVYALYGLVAYLFLILFPSYDGFPLQSLSRLVLELFPAFIVLAKLGMQKQVHLHYLVLASSLQAFFLLQFLVGFWTV